MKSKLFFVLLIPAVEGIALCIGQQNGYKYAYLSIMAFVLTGWICGIVIWWALEKKSEYLHKKTYMTAVVALMSIADQLIKVMVYRGLDTDITIIPNILKLRITRNYYQTAMFNFLKINMEHTYILVFKLLVMALFILLYRLFLKRKDNIYLRMAFIMILSAAISNFLDSLLWGYTLDYINYCGVMTIDLKDIYVEVGFGIGLYYYFEKDLDDVLNYIQRRKRG